MLHEPNWTTEFSRSFKNVSDLYKFLGWELDPELEKVSDKYPIFIPQSLASKIKLQGEEGVLAKKYLPNLLELRHDQGFIDPIGDKTYLKAPQLIHRYNSRALFTPTTVCPVHCRYCFRKNELNQGDEIFQQDFMETLSYLRDHPEISEIIFTGGDPLTLSNERLEKYLLAFAEIPSLRDIRFHTRYPVILPERIDSGFLGLMTNFSKIFRTLTIAIHVNHESEFDAQNILAIQKLTNSPLQLLSQTVLLKGINDSKTALVALYTKLVELKIRPYYLHHPDQVKGGMHFYLPLETGRELYHSLRKELPGWAIPQYVIDIPGGFGKVPAFNPETSSFSGQLMSRNGDLVPVTEPDFFV